MNTDDRQPGSLHGRNVSGTIGADAHGTAVAGGQGHGAHEPGTMKWVIGPRLAGDDKTPGQLHLTAPEVMPAMNCRESTM
ncbi:MAG: hypothetical protein Devi2KO_21960 [Devosia indica]